MSQPPANLIPALDRYRQGDLGGARATVEAALEAEPDSAALLGFAGLVAAQSGDLPAAILHLRAALAADPGDRANRLNFAMALVQTGALDEAGEVCAEHGNEPKLLRLAAYVHQERGRLAEAARAYRAVLAAVPTDFESWNNLGNVLVSNGEFDAAVEAFERAIGLRPDIVEMVLNLSEALALAERNERRRVVMRHAAGVVPNDVRVQIELGLAESAVSDFEAAERAFRAALRIDPRNLSAFLELGLVLENLNRTEELSALTQEAKHNGLTGAEAGFIQAWALRREGRFAEALPLAEAVPETINPIRRAQLIAQLYERLGDSERAFAAFEEMNRVSVEAKPPPPGPTYRERIAAATITPEQALAWRYPEVTETPPAPVFLAGFPRSGTTLLDTLLMNVPDFHVLEEQPVISTIEPSFPAFSDLGAMGADEIKRLRDGYFEVLADLAPPSPGQTVVDKHPLHTARMPVLHRLFPEARIILVERHPCDVVLSCFMANFQLNHAMRSFSDLEEAARTYDTVFNAWTLAETLLPLQVHRIRYERMVEDLEGEMRPLLAFLGREWDPAVLDNQGAAAARGHVRTASYAQVGEPIYKRSAGRWERYRDQLAPVLPILAPWAEKMGYKL
jgi:tetratricopeptide (TPR) repeat protein